MLRSCAPKRMCSVVDADVDATGPELARDEGQHLHVLRIVDVCDQGAEDGRRSVVSAEIGNPVVNADTVESSTQPVLLRERREPRALEIAVTDDFEIQAPRIELRLLEREIEDVYTPRQHGFRNGRAAAVSAERLHRLAPFIGRL